MGPLQQPTFFIGIERKQGPERAGSSLPYAPNLRDRGVGEGRNKAIRAGARAVESVGL